MSLLLRFMVVVVLAGLVPGLVWLGGTAPRTPAAVVPPPAPPAPAELRPQQATPVGMAGCAAAACHGGASPKTLTGTPDPDSWRGSAVHWLAGDPHTRAYSALTSDLGQHIMAGLRKADPTLPASAAEYDRCLACHTNPTLATNEAFGLSADHLTRLRAEGVGCEACHGNAGPWLTAHTVTTGPYPPSGMTDLNDIGLRAKACAGCHVGGPKHEGNGYAVVRDMNHDMIAAGHPRLNFELTEYERRLPPHWFERERTLPGRPARGPAFEAKAWLVGRVAVAEAACELLATRTDRAARAEAPWPEFAESNCFTCHHALRPESWRQTTPDYYAGRRPGALPWQTIWPVTSPTAFSALSSDAAVKAVTALKTAMTGVRPPLPETARGRAADAYRELARIRQALADPSANVPVTGIFRAADAQLGRADWDEAGQIYLGLAAVFRSQSVGSHAPAGEIVPWFVATRKGLELKWPTPDTRSDSPDDYSPEKVRSDLSALIAALLKNPTPEPARVP